VQQVKSNDNNKTNTTETKNLKYNSSTSDVRTFGIALGITMAIGMTIGVIDNQQAFAVKPGGRCQGC
jgi:hypothetical protein